MPSAPAGGVRLPWAQVPAGLRRAAERELGGEVTEAVTQSGGFSPGAAVRLRLDTGRRAFAKAVGPELNPDSPGLYRREAEIARSLPPHLPAPAFLAALEQDGWVMLLFEDIDGVMPAQPWRPAELAGVLAALTDLATLLDPAPWDAPAITHTHAGAFAGWRTQAAAAPSRAGPDDRGGLSRWARDHLPALAELEAGWAGAATGTALIHTDLRADNILLARGRVVFVDWPHACAGAPWIDLLFMAPSIRMQGGPPPEEVFTRHPVARGTDPAAVTAVLAALAGYFVGQSRRPDPPGLPTVRAFQAAQGRVALDWLKLRTGWR